jgi:hypothetical protein
MLPVFVKILCKILKDKIDLFPFFCSWITFIAASPCQGGLQRWEPRDKAGRPRDQTPGEGENTASPLQSFSDSPIT